MYVFYTNQKFPPWPSVAKVVFLFTSQLQDGKFMVCIFFVHCNFIMAAGHTNTQS